MPAAPPPRRTLLETLRDQARRSPWLRRRVKRSLAVFLRLVAGTRHEPAPRRPDLEPSALLPRTEELNRAAEHYYATYPEPEFILGKPFTEEAEFARRFFNLGVLFHFLHLSPHDVVLELGAGTCWLSHFLNRFGCKTVSVDVSETALELGRTLFERDPLTRWEAAPEFVVYDGHRIPLADGTVDKIVINDAFHHLPNSAEILGEMARLLPDGGRVVMCEPGPGHAETEDSRREVETTGVLENEIVLDELEAAAREAGFAEVGLVPVSLEGARPVPVGDLDRVAGTEAFLELWADFGRGTRYLVLQKGTWHPTTRRPGELRAEIEVLEPAGPLRLAPGEGGRLRLRVVNRGDTRWLATTVERPGWTRLGVHLHRAGEGGPSGPSGQPGSDELLDFDWLRVSLGADVDPGEERAVEVALPPLEAPGAYRLVLDLVAEGIVWFEQKGSPTTEIRAEVLPEVAEVAPRP